MKRQTCTGQFVDTMQLQGDIRTMMESTPHGGLTDFLDPMELCDSNAEDGRPSPKHFAMYQVWWDEDDVPPSEEDFVGTIIGANFIRWVDEHEFRLLAQRTNLVVEDLPA